MFIQHGPVLVLVKMQNRQYPEHWVGNTWEQEGGLNSL